MLRLGIRRILPASEGQLEDLCRSKRHPMLNKMLTYARFPIGLVIILLTGADLFTSNIMDRDSSA
jgi:hypothetical protein